MSQTESTDLAYQMLMADKWSAGLVRFHQGKKNNKDRLSVLEDDV
jgi:hypothetical protein